MKRLHLLVFLIVLFGGKAFSQDIISTRAGEHILARILSYTTTDIRFKRFDEKDSTVYTIPKAKVVVIRYEDGRVENFSTPGSSEEKFKAIGENPAPEEKPATNFQQEKIPVENMNKTIVPKAIDPNIVIRQKVKKYGAMKRTGVVMTIIGTVVFAGGLAAITDVGSNDYGSSIGRLLFEEFALASGIVSVGIGVPLWITGASSQHRYRNSLKSVTLQFSPQQRGLALRMHF